jgi:hypothetical protein
MDGPSLDAGATFSFERKGPRNPPKRGMGHSPFSPRLSLPQYSFFLVGPRVRRAMLIEVSQISKDIGLVDFTAHLPALCN